VDLVVDVTVLQQNAGDHTVLFGAHLEEEADLGGVGRVDHPLVLDDVVLTQDVTVGDVAGVFYQTKVREDVQVVLYVSEIGHFLIET
jgi:hypothetical protein